MWCVSVETGARPVCVGSPGRETGDTTAPGLRGWNTKIPTPTVPGRPTVRLGPKPGPWILVEDGETRAGS